MIGLAEDGWAKPGGMDDRIEVYGTKGVTFADLFRGNSSSTYSEDGYGYAAEKAGSTKGWTFTIFEEVFNQGYPHELQHFIQCVREDKTPLVTGEDGRAVLEMIYAAYASAQVWREGRAAVPSEGHKADRLSGRDSRRRETPRLAAHVDRAGAEPLGQHGFPRPRRAGPAAIQIERGEPRLGNVWQERCDSLSSTTPVIPPSPANSCQTGAATGRNRRSSITSANSDSSAARERSTIGTAPVRIDDPLSPGREHARDVTASRPAPCGIRCRTPRGSAATCASIGSAMSTSERVGRTLERVRSGCRAALGS